MRRSESVKPGYPERPFVFATCSADGQIEISDEMLDVVRRVYERVVRTAARRLVDTNRLTTPGSDVRWNGIVVK
jgi:hypothetical protein